MKPEATSNQTAEETTQEELLDSHPFMSHLLAFRDRVLRSVVAVLVVFIGLFSFSEELYLYVSEPI